CSHTRHAVTLPRVSRLLAVQCVIANSLLAKCFKKSDCPLDHRCIIDRKGRVEKRVFHAAMRDAAVPKAARDGTIGFHRQIDPVLSSKTTARFSQRADGKSVPVGQRFLVPSRTYPQLPARKQFLLRCSYRWRQDRAVIDRMKAVQNVVASPVSARRDAIVILEDFAVVTEDLVDFL